MESTDSSAAGSPRQHQPNLPPGFRFHPTDEELVVHYLKKKTLSAPLPVSIIAEVDLYKFDPWELPAKASFGEQEWYFFSPRDRKYPNGARPNRAATSGYWKATGTDKPVLTSGGTQKVGVKKALVFYGGKPPKGIKTNWIMHEYRLSDNKPASNRPPGYHDTKKNSLRLDDWVLCRIYKKSNASRPLDHHHHHHNLNIRELDHHTNHQHHGQDESFMSEDVFGGPTSSNSNNNTLMMMNNNTIPKLMSYDHQLFDGMLSSTTTDNHHNHNNNGATRTLLPGMYWPSAAVEDGRNKTSTDYSAAETAPQALLHGQQSELGALGDGIFQRGPFPLPGINWYS